MLTESGPAATTATRTSRITDWTDFDPSFWLLNGRAYPDTLARPDGGRRRRPDRAGRARAAVPADLVAGHCNAGERVLLRLSNLGYQNHAMTVDNIDLTRRRQGRHPAQGPRRHDRTTSTPTPSTSGPGESRDVIFTAPAARARRPTCSTTATYAYLDNGGAAGLRRHDDRDPRLSRPAPSAPRPRANA